MKKRYLIFLFSIIFFKTEAQVTVTGATAKTYTTLKAAFDDINKGAVAGKIDMTISGSTVETATATLNASGTNGANYSSVNILCTAASTISGAVPIALMTFNGAKNITINGRKLLTMLNSAANANTLTLINDATNINITGCTIKGMNTSSTGGVVFFGAGSATGNSGIKLDSCDIDGMNTAMYGIQSSGTTVTAAMENHNDTISNCNIFNYRQSTGNTAGIFLNYGSTGWVLKNNNIYQTQNVSSVVKGVMYGVVALPYLATDAHLITDNVIGGNGPAAPSGSLYFVATGSNAIGFTGMDIETAGPGNTIANNTIKNIVVNNNSYEGFQNSGIFCFISSFSGSSTITGNTITDITMTNSGGLIAIQGISCTVEASKPGTILDTFTINNNTIANITGNSAGNGDVQLYGIRLNNNGTANVLSGSTLKVQYNVSGNNLSNFNAPFAGTFTYIRGISNLNSRDTLPNITIIPTYAILKNNLHGFSTFSKLGSYTSAAIEGIKVTGGSLSANGSTISSISGNVIDDLNCTQTGDYSTTAIAIYTSNGSYAIDKNKIFSLKNQANGTTTYPAVMGIHARSSIKSTRISNNFISLGSEVNNDMGIFGILNSSQSDSIGIYFNTIVIAGNGSAAHRLTTAPVGKASLGPEKVNSPIILKNNILINKRGSGNADFVIFSPEGNGLVADHNDLFSATSGSIAFYNNSRYDFASYRSFSKQDVNSVNENVSFTDSLRGDLHLLSPPASLKSGIPIGGIISDIDEKTRDGFMPFLGAAEYLGTLSGNNPRPVAFKIFPNPAQDNVYIQIYSQHGAQSVLSITNVISQKVIYQSVTIPDGGTTVPLDVRFLEKGVYFIRLNVDGQLNTLKFIKL